MGSDRKLPAVLPSGTPTTRPLTTSIRPVCPSTNTRRPSRLNVARNTFSPAAPIWFSLVPPAAGTSRKGPPVRLASHSPSGEYCNEGG